MKVAISNGPIYRFKEQQQKWQKWPFLGAIFTHFQHFVLLHIMLREPVTDFG
jgi:hypothetical protein